MKMMNRSNKKRHNPLKPSRIIFLIVLLASNTLAWFIYATKVDTNVTVHVRAWNVVFEAGENQVTNVINVPVSDIYPGMDDYEYEINAYNRSEVDASISYQVLRANILGTEIISKEEKRTLGLTVDEQEDVSAAQLEAMLANSYPFSITISTSSNTIELGDGVASFMLSVDWPYENNQDDVDTYWGSLAYQYKESNPTLPSISLKIKITITQAPDSAD